MLQAPPVQNFSSQALRSRVRIATCLFREVFLPFSLITTGPNHRSPLENFKISPSVRSEYSNGVPIFCFCCVCPPFIVILGSVSFGSSWCSSTSSSFESSVLLLLSTLSSVFTVGSFSVVVSLDSVDKEVGCVSCFTVVSSLLSFVESFTSGSFSQHFSLQQFLYNTFLYNTFLQIPRLLCSRFPFVRKVNLVSLPFTITGRDSSFSLISTTRSVFEYVKFLGKLFRRFSVVDVSLKLSDLFTLPLSELLRCLNLLLAFDFLRRICFFVKVTNFASLNLLILALFLNQLFDMT